MGTVAVLLVWSPVYAAKWGLVGRGWGYFWGFLLCFIDNSSVMILLTAILPREELSKWKEHKSKQLFICSAVNSAVHFASLCIFFPPLRTSFLVDPNSACGEDPPWAGSCPEIFTAGLKVACPVLCFVARCTSHMSVHGDWSIVVKVDPSKSPDATHGVQGLPLQSEVSIFGGGGGAAEGKAQWPSVDHLVISWHFSHKWCDGRYIYSYNLNNREKQQPRRCGLLCD